MDKKAILQQITFGEPVAEQEAALKTYFVETDYWHQLFRGDKDIFYGAKGSGKSALYSLLINKRNELFDRNIFLMPAENPRGTPAFRDLTQDPPVTELEFINLWKLYFLSLLNDMFEEWKITSDSAKQLREALEREGLIKGSRSLASLLNGVLQYVKSFFRPPQAIESEIELDPSTQLPQGFTGRIIFSEPPPVTQRSDLRSVDHLLGLANDALSSSSFAAWIPLDRLDVAFSDNETLEANAIKALFRVYLDFTSYSNIKLKIFLRADIWQRITESGFREASHVVRTLTISWDKSSLLNLVVKRALHNELIRSVFGVPEDLWQNSIGEKEKFFYRIFPEKVDIGEKSPMTLDWLISRTRDAKVNAPRELIQFLNFLRTVQIKRFELGVQPLPEQDQLFARTAFKEALPMVSKVRLEQTLYAEHPAIKSWCEKLRGEKTEQSTESLAEIWRVTNEVAENRANTLANLGFFEVRGSGSSPRFWVPFIYRDSLDLVQGTAEL